MLWAPRPGAMGVVGAKLNIPYNLVVLSGRGVIFYLCSDCQRGIQGLIQADGARGMYDGGHVACHVGFAQGSVGGG